MKTDIIEVSGAENKIDKVLEQTEKAAAYKNLSPKSALHLRLLSEEMICMMRAIAGDVGGKFWIEAKEDVFELHLQVRTDMDFYQRKQLLSASTSGKNEANRGLMGKIRSFFEPVESVPVFFPVYGDETEILWTLHSYQTQLMQYVEQETEGALEAWDELEKSVVAHLADDVKVSIRGSMVEMVIFKKTA